MSAPYRHHVTVTTTRREMSGRETTETMHWIGTDEQIAERCARFVEYGLRNNHGAFTISPIAPHMVWDLDKN